MSDLRETIARTLHEAHKPFCDYTYPFEHEMSSRHVYEALADAILPLILKEKEEMRERAAKVAERDADWTTFGKRDVPQWDGGADGVRDYRIGIIAGRSIAAAIRGLPIETEGKGVPGFAGRAGGADENKDEG